MNTSQFCSIGEMHYIIKLYKYMGRDISEMKDDIANDFLTINGGRDDKDYAWFYDGITEGAICLENGDIIDSERIEELFC